MTNHEPAPRPDPHAAAATDDRPIICDLCGLEPPTDAEAAAFRDGMRCCPACHWPLPDEEAEAGAREGKAAPTPGPWVQGDNELLGPAARRMIYAAALATDPSGDDAPQLAYFQTVPFGPEEAEANARLACAAPALLAACRGSDPSGVTALDHLEYLLRHFRRSDPGGDSLPECQQLLAALRAAVTQAEGDPECPTP